MSPPPAPDAAYEGRSSILEATTLDTPDFHWLGLKKLTWQVGRRPLSFDFSERIAGENLNNIKRICYGGSKKSNSSCSE